MTERRGRRALFRRLVGRSGENAREERPPPSGRADERSRPSGGADESWRRGVEPMSDAQVQAALDALKPKPPAAPERPGYLDQLLGEGHAEPADARGPGSQRGRRLPVLPIVRPPGAAPEARFVEACDGCGGCLEACPHGAIRPLDGRHGPVAGTPTIAALESPCLMCEDFPCIAACDRGALLPEEPRTIGVAQIRQYDCLAYEGTFCSTCSERCPEPGAIERVNGKPRIVEDACTGCGVCQHVCPAPRNAILIVAPPRRLDERGTEGG